MNVMAEILAMKDKMERCPIQMASIQLYANEFENANVFYNDLVKDIKDIKLDQLSLKSKMNELIRYVKSQTEWCY